MRDKQKPTQSLIAKLIRLFWMATVCLLMALSVPAIVSDGAQKRVLVFYADRKEAPALAIMDNVFQSVLSEGLSGRLDYHNEYIDVARFPDQSYQDAFVAFLRHKYQGQHFDLLIASTPACTDFLGRYGPSLFPGVPVVFDGEEHPKRIPNSTGLSSTLDFKSTLELALALQPNVKQVFIVAGASAYDKYYEDLAREQFRPFERRISLTYLHGLSLADLKKAVATLPPDSIIYYLMMAEDGAGNRFLPIANLDQLVAVANAPTYGWLGTQLDHGIVGGSLRSVEKHSRQIAELALRVLRGERPDDIPITEHQSNVSMFDWRQLRRWGISETKLPPGSIVRFREPTFWEQYKWRIVAVISLCILQALLIVWLLINRNRRRRAELAKEKLATIVETSDDAILSKTLEGKIISWNAGAEKMYGYSASEIVGQHVSTLAPSELKGEVQEILEHIRSGESVDHRDTVRVTKEGRRIDVSLTVSPIKDNHGVIVGASTIARDMTERNRSQQAFQHLTGRLLMLQDEERRRVAGELHDGLGQNLAIIKNRAMVGLRDQTSQEAVMEQLEEIVLTANASILEVREIAHNLRPYELDRLGLVTAIESMIERVSDSTSIILSAALEPIDGLLAPETETSAYRIVQEGLNNVVKHSHATAARVEIKKIASQLVISVQDNGKGIPPPAPVGNGGGSHGFGLAGIAERARVLGGTFVVDSEPSRGTTLTVRLELQNGSAE